MLRLCPKAAEFASRAPRGRPGEGGKAQAREQHAGAAPGPGPRQGHLEGPTRRPQHRHSVLCTPVGQPLLPRPPERPGPASGETPRPRNRTANTRPGSLHPESVPPALLRPVSPSVWGPSRRAQVLLRPAVPPKPPQHSQPAPQKPPQHTRHRAAPSAQQHLRLPLNAAASANSSRQEAPKGLLQTAQRRLRILLRRTEQTPSQTPHNKAAPPHPSARGRTSESFYTTKRSLKILLFFIFVCPPPPPPQCVGTPRPSGIQPAPRLQQPRVPNGLRAPQGNYLRTLLNTTHQHLRILLDAKQQHLKSLSQQYRMSSLVLSGLRTWHYLYHGSGQSCRTLARELPQALVGAKK